MNKEQEVSIKPRAGLAFGLANWMVLCFWSSRAFRGTRKLSAFWLADVTPLGRSGSLLGLDIYFNST